MGATKYFYRVGLLSLLVPALGSFCLCACGTMRSHWGRHAGEFTPMYYSGVRLDASVIAANIRGPDSTIPDTDTRPRSEETIGGRVRSVALVTLDLPLSFGFDTILLPFHAWWHLREVVNPTAKVRSVEGSNEAGAEAKK